MYARTLDDQTLTLAVSGRIWKRNTLLIDTETRSFWSQSLGEAIEGPLKGQSLEPIPSTITDWATWVSRYPDTRAVIMDRTTTEFRRRVYKENDELLIGLTAEGQTRGWLFVSLRRDAPVNDEVGGQAVLVCYDHSVGTAVIFDRSVDGKLLTFHDQDGQLTDHETGTRWDRVTGVALAGPLQSQRLSLLPGTVSLYEAWTLFHPDSTYWLARQPSSM